MPAGRLCVCTMQAFCGSTHTQLMCPYLLWAALCCLFPRTHSTGPARANTPLHTQFHSCFFCAGGANAGTWRARGLARCLLCSAFDVTLHVRGTLCAANVLRPPLSWGPLPLEQYLRPCGDMPGTERHTPDCLGAALAGCLDPALSSPSAVACTGTPALYFARHPNATTPPRGPLDRRDGRQ